MFKRYRIAFWGLIVFFLFTSFSFSHLSLKGRWISNDDPKSILIITDTKFIEIYNRDTTYSNYIKSNHSCDTTYASSKIHSNFIKIDDGRCFEIIGLSSNGLSLRYATRGNLLLYHKR